MAFDLQTWKNKVKEQLTGWRDWMTKAGINSIYAGVASSTLWPVVEAARQGEWAALTALGSVLAGMGGGLLTQKIQDWKDRVSSAKEIEKEIKHDAALRKEIDAVLQKLEAFSLAREELPANDREWYDKTLQAELQQLGNFQHFQATLHGSGAIAQGEGATALGEGATFIRTEKYVEKEIQNVDTDDPKALRRAYLSHLFGKCRPLSLSGIDPKAASEDDTQNTLNLDAVYTALRTTTPETQEDLMRGRKEDQQIHYRSALELLNEHDRLVLMGDPGSGKSTFINFVTLCLTGAALERLDVNLDMLRAPLPAEDSEEGAKPQPWSHGALLAVRVVLRDFAARGLPEENTEANCDHLWNFIVAQLPGPIREEFAKGLKQDLLEKGGLLLLDGLDEVPEAKHKRTQIKQAVEDFAATFGNCRMLVTTRTYAYQKQDWKLNGFAEGVIAPFSKAQIRTFVDHWYQHVADIRHMESDEAKGNAELLKSAILENDRLLALAERPLLLTLMASLHAWRGGTLPNKREELYADAVDLLLDLWERPKTVKNPQGNLRLVQPSLAQFLKVDKEKVHSLLNELAFNVHSRQPELVGTADVPQSDLVNGLMRIGNNPDVNPNQLIEYLTDRAGLLLPRGEEVYTFPHRTFQEYLAACHLTDKDDFVDELARLTREEPGRWREVALLAAAKSVRGASFAIWPLVDCLSHVSSKKKPLTSQEAWGSHLAGQVLVESAKLEDLNPANRKKVETVTGQLAQIIRVSNFPAIERAHAGRNLAVLGDPRLEVLTLEHMPFCLVPAGPFWMGEGSEAVLNERLKTDFWISKYPVTQAQFAEFVKAGGYEIENAWSEARDAGIWKQGGIKGFGDREFRQAPHEYREPFTLPNHPVVGVTWYEALVRNPAETCH